MQTNETAKRQKIISEAMKYASKPENNGLFPERRLLAKLTGYGLCTVSNVVKEIEKQTGICYARNLTPKERGERANLSRLGKEYELR